MAARSADMVDNGADDGGNMSDAPAAGGHGDASARCNGVAVPPQLILQGPDDIFYGDSGKTPVDGGHQGKVHVRLSSIASSQCPAQAVRSSADGKCGPRDGFGGLGYLPDEDQRALCLEVAGKFFFE